MSGQDLVIDTQIGYEVLPATPTPATPTRHHLQNMKERSKKRPSAPTGERKERAEEKFEENGEKCGENR